MPENPERSIIEDLQALWTLSRLLFEGGELPPRVDPAKAAREAISIAEKLIGWPTPNDFLPPKGASERAHRILASDGAATGLQTSNAKRFTEALRGEFDGERGVAECPSCRQRTLALIPRAERVEVFCPSCDPLAVEVETDALLDARGVVDFRPEFVWRDRVGMRR
jgi:hypothetical protein